MNPEVEYDLQRDIPWTPKEALQFYADGKHFDTVDGRTRILDVGAIAGNALKSLDLERLEMKGDSELSALRAEVERLKDRVSELTQRDPSWFDMTTAHAFQMWSQDQAEVVRLRSRVAELESALRDCVKFQGCGDPDCCDEAITRLEAEFDTTCNAEELRQVRDDNHRLQAEVKTLKKQFDSVATTCELTLVERDRLQAEVDNLAALVRILVHSLRKVNPNSSNIIRAMAYLTRKGLTGSILRSDEPQPQEIPESGGHIESADCWCGPTVEEHPGGTLIIHNQTH